VKRGTKTVLIWGLLLGVVFVALLSRNPETEEPPAFVSTEESLEMIKQDRIDSYSFRDQELFLVTVEGELLAVHPPINALVSQQLQQDRIPYVPDSDPPSGANAVMWLLVVPILVVLALFVFLRRMGGGQMNNVFELRKTKARPVEDADKAQFADIGGNQGAVELLADIVDFLREPKRWMAAGTRIPRGVLVVGPPGSGKTLLARAVAGETQSAFFYTSASEFVELFVGIGAARVRDTFEKAAAQQPAVIFIDELDAIGRRRGSGLGTMHEEREQTLNQLLVLMDGLEQHERMVVMAATNRPDVLDPALLRSGRFDRVLRLEPPTSAERIEILKIHTRKKPLDAGVSLERIAGQTESFTGAQLEALTNDAALLAVRRSRDDENGARGSVLLTMDDFDRALETMTRSNRQFDRLDSVLVESVSQFAEPVGRAVARITLTTGTVVEGEVLWMNAAHIKLRIADGSEVVVAKEMAEQIVPLVGTELTPEGDFTPDRWAGRDLDVG
jgi:cell division protease FtsH